MMQGERLMRKRLLQYSAQNLVEALPPSARPAKRKRDTNNKKRLLPDSESPREASLEAKFKSASERHDLDFANTLITVPGSAKSPTSLENPTFHTLVDSQGTQSASGSGRHVAEKAPADDPPCSRVLTLASTDVVDTPPLASHLPNFQASSFHSRPFDGVNPPQPTSHLPGFQAPGLDSRPCDGVTIYPSQPASHRFNFQAPSVSNYVDHGDGKFPPPSASHTFDFRAPGLDSRPCDGVITFPQYPIDLGGFDDNSSWWNI